MHVYIPQTDRYRPIVLVGAQKLDKDYNFYLRRITISTTTFWFLDFWFQKLEPNPIVSEQKWLQFALPPRKKWALSIHISS